VHHQMHTVIHATSKLRSRPYRDPESTNAALRKQRRRILGIILGIRPYRDPYSKILIVTTQLRQTERRGILKVP